MRTVTQLALAGLLCLLPSLARAELGVSAELDPDRVEVALLPGVTVSTETGFGFGVLGAVAGFEPGYTPYRWRLQASVQLSVREGPDGDVEWPVQSYWLLFDLPELGARWLRLSGKVGYRQHAALGWYGIGNGSSDSPPAHADGGRWFRYERLFPEATVMLRARLGGELSVFGGATFSYSQVTVGEGRLAMDLDDDPRSLLVGARPHGDACLRVGLIYDSRDHETSPTRGMLHEVALEAGAGLGESFAYGRLHAQARFFVPIAGRRLVVAARLLADVMVGEPPFYELSRMGGSNPVDGPAGAHGIRGVPAQRYAGEVKLVGNVELRSHIVGFEVGEQRFTVGVAAFADAGRVFAELTEAHPGLDGGDLKLGLGGGLRLGWGETFVGRIDAAWSPDGVGFYALAGHPF
ncbi:MAG: hypothetical protein AMXMBFR64_42610 [Myxococcales bacterium]